MSRASRYALGGDGRRPGHGMVLSLSPRLLGGDLWRSRSRPLSRPPKFRLLDELLLRLRLRDRDLDRELLEVRERLLFGGGEALLFLVTVFLVSSTFFFFFTTSFSDDSVVFFFLSAADPDADDLVTCFNLCRISCSQVVNVSAWAWRKSPRSSRICSAVFLFATRTMM